jgi:hypothetical protein
MEAISYSEKSVNPGSTHRHIPEDDILQMNNKLEIISKETASGIIDV